MLALAFAVAVLVDVARAQPPAGPIEQDSPRRFNIQAANLSALLKAADQEDADLWEPVRRVVLAKGLFRPDDLQAYEEHRLFVYALAARGRVPKAAQDATPGAQGAPAWTVSRRVLLVRPSTLVVEDCLRAPEAERLDVPWTVRCPEPSEDTPWPARIATAEGALLWRSVHPLPARPQSSPDGAGQGGVVLKLSATPANGTLRFVQAFSLDHGEPGEPAPPAARYGTHLGKERTRLDIFLGGRQYAVNWPNDPWQSGRITVRDNEEILLPERLLPAGILPHGPTGMRLMERWDAAYQGRRAGWDLGRPSSELKEAVEQGVLRPCRVVELGCGTGTNAIYLAQKGFDVTAIDIAPTALRLAEEKARQAGVRVRWLVADVLHPPRLEPFELVYDRGCYHGVRRRDAAGYVRALKQLTRPGARVLILAGNANEARHYGPPRVKEEELRADFSRAFEFDWLKETHFDTREADRQGALAWSILLRRKSEDRSDP